MEDKLTPDEPTDNSEDLLELPEMEVNDYGQTLDSAVVIEEEDRTVLLTEDETIIIDKSEDLSHAAVPKNRPRHVYKGMWGQTEIIAVGLGMMAVLAVIIMFVFFVLPAKKEFEENRARSIELEVDLKSATDKYGSITDTKSEVGNLIRSVDDFESRFLRIPANGQTALYQRLNGLISAYGLINTAGPDYMPLEILDPQRRQQTEAERGRDKLISLFPGVYVSVTVEGSYQNLRRFIREIETSDQFIMISAVELVPAESSGNEGKKDTAGQPPQPQPPVAAPGIPGIPGQPTALQNRPATADTGKTHGETVSLKLEMAAYFSRAGTPPIGAEVSQK